MKTPSYIAINLKELYGNAPRDILALIEGGEVDSVTATIGKIYKLPMSSFIPLSNIITFVLIGAILPENTVRAIVDMLGLSEEEALRLAQDLEKSIFEKARVKVLNKSPKDMVTLTFQEERSPDELRKEILDTTKREPIVSGEQPAQLLSAAAASQTGTRSQLMEQLQILGQIPDDEEVANRLKKIQEQVAQIQVKEKEVILAGEDNENERPPAIQIAIPQVKSATYSRAPTKYNVDPYREVAEES